MLRPTQPKLLSALVRLFLTQFLAINMISGQQLTPDSIAGPKENIHLSARLDLARARPLKDNSLSSAINSPMLQQIRDEFNTTERPFKQHLSGANEGSSSTTMSLVRRILLSQELSSCCPTWSSITQVPEIVDEQRRLFGKNSPKASLKASDLMAELKQVYLNITYLSIDGQPGVNAPDKYYKFYDNVHYYLRLMLVAEAHLAELEQQQAVAIGVASPAGSPEASSSSKPTDTSSNHIQTSATKQIKHSRRAYQDEAVLRRDIRRQLSSISFRISQDPILASFLDELLQSSVHRGTESTSPSLRLLGQIRPLKLNENFDLYETFIRYTNFGQHYASNISLVRESSQVFELICAHLNQINFPSNLTRPSKQYAIVRRLSHELFRIRHELIEKVNLRILSQNKQAKRIFDRLNDLIAAQPHIRMLGDEFGDFEDGREDERLIDFSDNVRTLAHLLDLYTTDNLTQLSFYNQLSELPEEFIILGLVVAHDYEIKELPMASRFISDHYNWDHTSHFGNEQKLHPQSLQNLQQQQQQQHNDSQKAELARKSNKPFLSKIFG